MSSRLKFVVILLTLFSWPFNLYLANTKGNFINYLIPLLLLCLSFLLYKKGQGLFLFPALVIPLVQPKLALFPLLLVLFLWPFVKRNKLYYLNLVLSFFVLLFVLLPFKGQTIFTPDYEARQAVLRKINLYPNPFLARVFQNKGRIYLDKFSQNLFALSDPNNYFFRFHPREIIISNQNLEKYPFLAIFFLFLGIFSLKKSPNKNFIVASFTAGLLSLSFLTIFDRNDFILWLPISLTIIAGINQLSSKRNKYVYGFFAIYILFALIQFVRNYMTFSL